MVPVVLFSLCICIGAKIRNGPKTAKKRECIVTVVITSNARVVHAPRVHTHVSVNLFMCKKCKCLNYGVSVSRSF